MEKNEVRVHDCIEVVKTHKDPERKYYGGTYRGIVVSTGESFTIIDAYNDEVDFPKDDEGEHTFSFNRYSEIQFLTEIKKAAESKNKEMVAITEKLASIDEWYRTVKFDISLLGKLAQMGRELVNK